MEHEVENQDEALEVIVAYLERLGIQGLRQPYETDQINKSAVIRYLINEKLQEILANPPAPEGERHRAGQARKKSKIPTLPTDSSSKLRKGSRS